MRLDKAIESLRPEERTLLHLHYYEERSLAEIAEVMDVAAGPLANRLQRIRQKLKKLLSLTIEH
jgi:RNA polymerase sigma-70 factor (ECF subfamily)